MSGRLFALLIAAGAVMAVGPAAWADGGSVAIQCRQGQGPGCTVTASNQTVFPSSSAKVEPASITDGVCHNSEGKVAPCFIPEFGWLGTAGCYWKVDTGYSPPAWDTADQHQGEQGAWFDFTCLDVRNGTGGGIVWLPTAPGGGLAPPPPVVLARQATNRLVLFPLAIEASPDPSADQLVNLPTWLWVSRSSWRPVSATASVPGESVTATATPESVSWSMGDGSKVVCRGPGTPYTKAQNPRAPSPDCGHTYPTSSAEQLNGAYPVSTTVTWLIRWAGGGQSGTFPALTTTSSALFRVAESQAVNTEPGGG